MYERKKESKENEETPFDKERDQDKKKRKKTHSGPSWSSDQVKKK